MNLLDLTAVELAKEIKAGNTTAVEAMQAVIDQIEKTEETFPSVSNRACSGGLRGSCGGNCSVAVWKDA